MPPRLPVWRRHCSPSWFLDAVQKDEEDKEEDMRWAQKKSGYLWRLLCAPLRRSDLYHIFPGRRMESIWESDAEMSDSDSFLWAKRIE